MKRFALSAGLALLLGAAPAFGQDGPRMVGGGDDAQVVYGDGARGNVVGGGRTTLGWGVTGGIVARYQDPMPANAAGVATMTGGGDDAQMAYAPVARPSGLASRR